MARFLNTKKMWYIKWLLINVVNVTNGILVVIALFLQMILEANKKKNWKVCNITGSTLIGLKRPRLGRGRCWFESNLPDKIKKYFVKFKVWHDIWLIKSCLKYMLESTNWLRCPDFQSEKCEFESRLQYQCLSVSR